METNNIPLCLFQMWQIILLAALPFITGGVIKPLDDSIWKNKLAEIILDVEDNTIDGKGPVFHNHIEDGIEGNYRSKIK